MAAQKKTINFIPGDELEKSPIGRFLKWALVVGRYITIFTELIVIIVFLSRFKLDRDLNDLHEEIIAKQTIIASSIELENEVRFLQKRLEIINKAQDENLNTSIIIDELTSLIPTDVVFSNLKINKKSVILTGTSFSNLGLANLTNGLIANEHFENVNLKSVSSEGENNPALDFEIETNLLFK